MKNKEVRKLDLQFRAERTEDNKMEIKGYAAVFDSPETYGYTEIIAPTAFDEADMSDVVLRYNHNDGHIILARTRNKSLNLEVDKSGKYGKRGLFMDAILQDNIQGHIDVYNAIPTGLIDKQSFAFTVEKDNYDYDTDTRTITKIGKVFDVSVVDQPFYNATDVSVARDLNNDDFLARREELRKAHELELEEKRKAEELEKKKQELLAKLG